MLTEEDADRVHLNVWSAFVLGYGFAVGVLLAQITVAIVAGVIFALIWSATR
jgi:hypothetical protein